MPAPAVSNSVILVVFGKWLGKFNVLFKWRQNVLLYNHCKLNKVSPSCFMWIRQINTYFHSWIMKGGKGLPNFNSMCNLWEMRIGFTIYQNTYTHTHTHAHISRENRFFLLSKFLSSLSILTPIRNIKYKILK